MMDLGVIVKMLLCNLGGKDSDHGISLLGVNSITISHPYTPYWWEFYTLKNMEDMSRI